MFFRCLCPWIHLKVRRNFSSFISLSSFSSISFYFIILLGNFTGVSKSTGASESTFYFSFFICFLHFTLVVEDLLSFLSNAIVFPLVEPFKLSVCFFRLCLIIALSGTFLIITLFQNILLRLALNWGQKDGNNKNFAKLSLWDSGFHIFMLF